MQRMHSKPSNHAAYRYENSPFVVENEREYQEWRRRKLRLRPQSVDELFVRIADPWQLSASELLQLKEKILRANLALYQLDDPQSMSKSALKAMCAQLGMHRLDNNLCSDSDGISSITVRQLRNIGEYIPYTNSPISWHCDGYYNAAEFQIRGMVLHCVHQAGSGGRNGFLDPELVYIALRDVSSDYINALMQSDAMVIPANEQGGSEIRPAVSGPVFSVDDVGRLHMRYTARTRSIAWKSDDLTQAAAASIRDYLNSSQDDQYFHCLQAGQGIISNNVLHCRDGFEDSADTARLLYRARYYDAVDCSLE